MSLLQVIKQYDHSREEYIRILEERVEELRSKIHEMIDQGMKDAHASQNALLQGILSGAIDKPREHKVWIAFNGTDVGPSDIAGIFSSEQKATDFANAEDCDMCGPFEIL